MSNNATREDVNPDSPACTVLFKGRIEISSVKNMILFAIVLAL